MHDRFYLIHPHPSPSHYIQSTSQLLTVKATVMPNLLHSLHNARDFADTNTTDIANSSADSGDRPSKALIAAWVMVVAISFIFALTSLFTCLSDRKRIARSKQAIDATQSDGTRVSHYRPAHGVFGQAEHSQLVYDDPESAVAAHGQQSCETLPTMPPTAHRSFY